MNEFLNWQDAVAVEYMTAGGPKTVSAFLSGDSIFHRVGYAYFEQANCGELAVDPALRLLGTRTRIYDNALFARFLENCFELPRAASFHDVRTMARLLETQVVQQSPRCGNRPRPIATILAQGTLNSYQSLAPRVYLEGLWDLYSQVELPIIDAVVQMMSKGVPIDVPVLEQIYASADTQCEILRHQLNDAAGYYFNANSHEEVRHLLYGRLGFPVVLCSRTGLPSISHRVLRHLQHPVGSLLQQYRAASSVANAAWPLLRSFCPRTGCVHADLDPLGTDTGRFSCSNPNLQGLPRQILPAIRARDGSVLIEADISQAELRVLAHFSQDPSLIRCFQQGDVDLHRRTAALVLGISEESVTGIQRSEIGKPINFGVIYGETDHGLSEDLGVSISEAQEFLGRYFRAYPQVAAWINATQIEVARRDYVCTLLGRKRRLPHVHSRIPGDVNRAHRQAVNTIIQGTAADLLKQAIIRLHATLPPDAHLILTVHDSVLLEVPEGRVAGVVPVVRAAFEEPFPRFTVPIQVEIGVGKTWADAKSNMCPVGLND